MSPESCDLLDTLACIVFGVAVVAGTVAFLCWLVSWR
jgi:hypothetical protein